MSAKRILLVDGTNIVMRYAHAMMPHGSVGEPEADDVTRERASDVFGAVERAIRECALHAGAAYCIVALDSAESWRKAIFDGYKASRATAKTGWWSVGLQDRLSVTGVRCEISHGYEADDVIATLDVRGRRAGLLTAVLSGDSDLLVLASDQCDVYQFGRKDEPRFVKRSPEWIAKKYQIANAAQLRDFKAIVGESGDCLPGIDGYGPVKARALLARHGSAEALLASVAITIEQTERLKLMLQLVTLRTDAPLEPIVPATCRLIAG